MRDRVFLDTNILIYVYSVDEKEKQAKAAELIETNRETLLISNQVINELCNTYVIHFSKSFQKLLRKLPMYLLSLAMLYLSLSLAFKHNLKRLD